jgi:hypothetical protein
MNDHSPSDISGLRQKIDDQLDDLKEMLAHRRLHMQDAEWIDFVHRARKSILEHPDQYLEGELPTPEILLTVVNAILDDFVKSIPARRA